MDFVQYLPPELSLHIFSFIDHVGLSSVALVCHSWLRLARDPSLWNNVCLDSMWAAEYILSRPQFSQIRKLTVAEFFPKQVDCIAHYCAKLYKLKIESCFDMTAQSFHVIFHCLPRLVSLELRHLDIPDIDLCRAMENAACSTGLLRLTLAFSTKITDCVSRQIADTFPNLQQLSLLELDNLTSATANAIATLTNLQKLDISCCFGIKRHAIQELSKRLPRLRVIKTLDIYLQDLPAMIDEIFSVNSLSDIYRVYRTNKTLNTLLMFSNSSYVSQQLASTNTIHRLLSLLVQLCTAPGNILDSNRRMRLFAECIARNLSYFAYDDNDNLLVRIGAISQLSPLLARRGSFAIRRDVLWTLANILPRHKSNRDAMIQGGAVARILAMAPPGSPDWMNRRIVAAIAWALHGICLHSKPPPLDIVQQIVQVLKRLVTVDDEITAREAAIAYGHIFRMYVEQAQSTLVDRDALRELGRWMMRAKSSELMKALLVAVTNLLARGEMENSITECEGENPYSAIVKEMDQGLNRIGSEDRTLYEAVQYIVDNLDTHRGECPFSSIDFVHNFLNG